MLEEILLVNEKTGEYEFELGLIMLVSGCNVTSKNVKTNKILPAEESESIKLDPVLTCIDVFFYRYIPCFRRNLLKIDFLSLIS